jgi:hypothetical protein
MSNLTVSYNRYEISIQLHLCKLKSNIFYVKLQIQFIYVCINLVQIQCDCKHGPNTFTFT